MNLWLFSVIPSLLPFFIITEVLKEINGIPVISRFPSRFLCPLLGISSCSSYAVVAGWLCGYPMGAKVTADLYKSRQITRTEAHYLLTFVNHPSPIFVSTYIFTKSLDSRTYFAYSLFVLYASALLTALIYSISFRRKNKPLLRPELSFSSPESDSGNILDNSIYRSFHIILKIGGYLILFSILAAILTDWLQDIPILHTCLAGILETTTGIFSASFLSVEEYEKAAFMCLFAAFGGCSTIFQTKSMIDDSGLSILPYIKGKLTTVVIAGILFTFPIW